MSTLCLPASIVKALYAAINPTDSTRDSLRYVHWLHEYRMLLASNGHVMYYVVLNDHAGCMPERNLHFADWPKIHATADTVEICYGIDNYTMKVLTRRGAELQKINKHRKVHTELSIPDFQRAIPNISSYKCVSGAKRFSPHYLGKIADCFTDAVNVEMYVSDDKYKPLVVRDVTSREAEVFDQRTLIIMGCDNR